MDKLHITRSTITRALAYGRGQGLLTERCGKKDVRVNSYSLTFPNWFVREDPVEDEELFFRANISYIGCCYMIRYIGRNVSVGGNGPSGRITASCRPTSHISDAVT